MLEDVTWLDRQEIDIIHRLRIPGMFNIPYLFYGLQFPVDNVKNFPP